MNTVRTHTLALSVLVGLTVALAAQETKPAVPKTVPKVPTKTPAPATKSGTPATAQKTGAPATPQKSGGRLLRRTL